MISSLTVRRNSDGNKAASVRRRLLPLALAGMLAAPGMAMAQPAPGPAGVAAPVQTLDNALLQTMKSGRSASFRQRFDMLAPVIDRNFDLNLIVQHAVGLQWSQLPPARRQQLVAAYRNYAVASYVSNFDSYSGQSFQISPQVRDLGNGEQVVQTKLASRDGAPTELDYVMQNVGGQWKVVDVLANGAISQVATQRSDFRSLLTDGTGDRLIASLQQKVSRLSDGSLA
jgi:phospholipid transport system substrate-binding protein